MPMDLTELLKFVTKKEASDLHLKPGRPPLLRVNGRLVPLKTDPLSPKDLEDMVLPILSPMQREKLMVNYSVDIGHGVQGVARFRGNIFLQRGSWTAVFRRIPFQIPSVADLNLPDVLGTFMDLPNGLVLVTGPTGSGKSTTLASVMKGITERHPVHIVTIEDPIEYLFQDNLASVSQREVGTDTVSFEEALKNALRQDPDVIMVGEMRDWETMSTAITAAETGHLVFSTLHTNNAAQTIDRIMDSCPPTMSNQVRRQVALVLRGIVSMSLIERVDGKGQIPVVEVLINSPKIAKQIENGETKEILEEMETSVGYYKMQSMNQSLIALLVNGIIGIDKAMAASSDPEDLSLKLRKLFPEIEEKLRGGITMPSPNDFSAITELMDVKKLYEEQEEKWRLRLQEKEDLIAQLEQEIRDRERMVEARMQQQAAVEGEVGRMRQENERVKQEAAARIAQLNDRIRELNQRLMGAGGAAAAPAPAPQPPSGFFKR
ncbi:MAG: PilT/PilU family type 4a pilus ATPase [Acidobacteria bacterium]|nr:PilT/PilU family type 4a pilus ATPase [Acidobacteriota bacterium]